MPFLERLKKIGSKKESTIEKARAKLKNDVVKGIDKFSLEPNSTYTLLSTDVKPIKFGIHTFTEVTIDDDSDENCIHINTKTENGLNHRVSFSKEENNQLEYFGNPHLEGLF